MTTDDPAFEDPQAIAAEIDAHIDHDRVGQVEYVADRREAIETAIQAARAGDLVVLAGKGTDQYQKVAGVDTPTLATSPLPAKWSPIWRGNV